MSDLYGRVIPESLAEKVCNPGKHHHLWYEVDKATFDIKWPTVLELHCSCGIVIRYAQQQYSQLLIQILEDLEKATYKQQLSDIKAQVPESVFEQAWDMASTKLKRHCHKLSKRKKEGK